MNRADREVLVAIGQALRATGVCPSCAELCEAAHLPSKSSVSRAVRRLEAMGLIRMLPNRARAMEPTTAGWRFVPTVVHTPNGPMQYLPVQPRIAAPPAR